MRKHRKPVIDLIAKHENASFRLRGADRTAWAYVFGLQIRAANLPDLHARINYRNMQTHNARGIRCYGGYRTRSLNRHQRRRVLELESCP
jgi:hypothetical protein